MKTFKIEYFLSNCDGQRTGLEKLEIFEGTYEQAVERVEATPTGWPYNYEVGQNPSHGMAVITELNTLEELEKAKRFQLYLELKKEFES